MNKSFGLGCLGVLILGAILGISGCRTYSSLVGLSETVDQQWAQVAKLYQQRLDLASRLAVTVEGQPNIAPSILVDIADARASIGRVQFHAACPDEQTMQQWEAAQTRMGGALAKLVAASESLAPLPANAAFSELKTEFIHTESQLTAERSRFNEAAQGFNTEMKQFPTVVYAALTGFYPKGYFKTNPPAAVLLEGGATAGSTAAPTASPASAKPSPATQANPEPEGGTLSNPDGTPAGR